MRYLILSTLSILVFSANLKAEEFLFLCEASWQNGEKSKVRCAKEPFGKKDKISEKALRGIHKVQIKDMKRRFSGGKCSTRTNRTRMSLDVRSTCKNKVRVLEFISIWPLDSRTKQYFRTSMPEIIEGKVLEFFRRTHITDERTEPMFDWSR